MGYLKDLGTSIVERIDPATGYPVDRYGHLLDPISPRDGTPVKDWDKPGTELYNFTNPYGHLHFAVGSGDDFHCLDYATINAGPRGQFCVLHSTINSETGSFIQDAEYLVLPANSMSERARVIALAYGLTDGALEWCSYSDIEHARKGWNQDPTYFARAVARSLFDWQFRAAKPPITERQMRFGGVRVERIIDSIIRGK